MREAKENQFHLIKWSAPGRAAAISPDGAHQLSPACPVLQDSAIFVGL